MRQQDKKSTGVIFDRLDSVLLNMKLVGADMNPEELQNK